MTPTCNGAPLNAWEQAWLTEVGGRLRTARLISRLSQDALAAKAGVSRVSLGSIERAEHVASLLMYRRLAAALDLPLADLVADLPDEAPKQLHATSDRQDVP